MSETLDAVSVRLAALRDSQRRLAQFAATLDEDAVGGPSYDTEWTIAQVLSHLGSGAEIFNHFLDAGLRGESAPGGDVFQAVWAEWDAKTPARQVADGVAASAALHQRIGDLNDDERTAWRLEFFGASRGLDGLLQLRLGEHALHTWDVVVTRDPSAVLDPSAVALIVDAVVDMVPFVAKVPTTPITAVIATSAPTRVLELDARDAVSLSPKADAAADADLRLSAEEFIRLLAGRLDPAHASTVVGEPALLDQLRQVFPGF